MAAADVVERDLRRRHRRHRRPAQHRRDHLRSRHRAGGAATLERARVAAYRADGAGGWDYAGDASTDATGLYTIGRLPDGTYRVQFDAAARTFTEWYDNQTSRADADDVVVPRGRRGDRRRRPAHGGQSRPGHGHRTDRRGPGRHLGRRPIARTGAATGTTSRTRPPTPAATTRLRRLLRRHLQGRLLRLGPQRLRRGVLGRQGRLRSTRTPSSSSSARRGPASTPSSRGRAASPGRSPTRPARRSADIRVAAYGVTGDGEWSYIADATTDATGRLRRSRGCATGRTASQFRDWSGFWAPEWFDDQPTLAAADDVDGRHLRDRPGHRRGAHRERQDPRHGERVRRRAAGRRRTSSPTRTTGSAAGSTSTT